MAAGVEWSMAIEQASWIGPRLSPFGEDRVDSVIPGGFGAYARLPHPVWRTGGEGARMVRWGEVAAWSGVRLDRQTQFHDIALPRRAPAEPAPWDGHGPAEGALPAHDAAVLVELLAGYTAADRCWFCLWDGYGLDRAVAYQPEVPPDPVPDRVRTGPRVRLPGREYLLFTGPVNAALALAGGQGHTPNLWWPHDRSWCVASEIDLPWTYLAGPDTLIETVLADPRLEVLPAQPDDPIQLRVRGWLAGLVEDAAAELLERGTVTVTTSRGRVHARMTRPTRRRRGRLHTDYEAVNGVGGSGDTALTSRSGDALLTELRRSLILAVTSLANG